MSEDVDVRITPSLHPNNVKQVDGYDDDTAPYLAPVETAFSEAYLGIAQVIDARAAAAKNPVLNEAGQLIMTQDFADKIFSRIAKHMDGAKANLDKGIAHIEGELSAPVKSKAGSVEGSEIRAHVAKLPTGERLGFLQRALDELDHDTLTAVLGARPYLSGLTGEMQKQFLRLYHERNSPNLAKRLKAMASARDLILQRSGLVHKALEKAVGCPPHKAAALRAAQTAAEKAFVMRDL